MMPIDTDSILKRPQRRRRTFDVLNKDRLIAVQISGDVQGRIMAVRPKVYQAVCQRAPLRQRLGSVEQVSYQWFHNSLSKPDIILQKIG